MTRALILVLALVLALGLALASGCSSPQTSPPGFTLLADDTIVVTGHPEDLNLAIMQASFAIGDPHAHPETGVRRLPSYHERSEFRTVKRGGRRVQSEQRVIRFETPDGVTVETRAVYTDNRTTLSIATNPASAETREAYASEITRLLRERGIDERR